MQDAVSESQFLQHIVIFLAMAVVVVSLVRRLRVSPVVGYLVAGGLVGPAGIGLITDVESVQDLADLGVVFLLFAIGLDLSLARLRAMRWYAFGLGGLQVLVCSLLIGGAASWFGLAREQAFIVGVALSLSSTAMVMALLRERGEMMSQTGRIALAILLLQDLLVVPLLVVVPRLGGDGHATLVALALAFAKGALALVAIVVLGRVVLAPVFRVIAAQKNADLMTGLTLLVVLGASWATEHAGLSLALGAFLAGLLLAETEFRHQVEADIQPFRGILLGLFFMTVGMSMNLGLLLSDWPLVLGLVLGVMAVKTLATTALCRAFGFRLGFALNQGLLLAQAGEFAFVLLALAMTVGALPRNLGELLVLVTGLTIAATPLSAALGRFVLGRLERSRGAEGERLRADTADLSDHIVIAAYGRIGQIVGQLLDRHELPYVAIDLDSGLVEAARAKGLPAFYGDASNQNVLRAAGAERARAAIVTIDGHEAALRAVVVLRQHYPELPILARGRDRAECVALQEAGATATVLEAMESALHLGVAVLQALGIGDGDTASSLTKFRANNYAALNDIIPPEGGKARDAAQRGVRHS
jgi:CPA2 family monovalent cation:H+ antiporter-2